MKAPCLATAFGTTLIPLDSKFLFNGINIQFIADYQIFFIKKDTISLRFVLSDKLIRAVFGITIFIATRFYIF